MIEKTPLQTAIALTLDHELDYNELLQTLAKNDPAKFLQMLGIDLTDLASRFLKADPEIFVKYAKSQIVRAESGIKIVSFLKAGAIVSAIKELREATGLGLKEAKDVIELFNDQMMVVGIIPRHPRQYTTNPLTNEQVTILDYLISLLK